MITITGEYRDVFFHEFSRFCTVSKFFILHYCSGVQLTHSTFIIDIHSLVCFLFCTFLVHCAIEKACGTLSILYSGPSSHNRFLMVANHRCAIHMVSLFPPPHSRGEKMSLLKSQTAAPSQQQKDSVSRAPLHTYFTAPLLNLTEQRRPAMSGSD